MVGKQSSRGTFAVLLAAGMFLGLFSCLGACTGEIGGSGLDDDRFDAATIVSDADPSASDADPFSPDAAPNLPDALPPPPDATPLDPNDVAQMCTRWKADRADMSEGTWTGSVAGCNAGDIGVGRANTLRLVNLYRWIADLPGVTNDPTKDAAAQECALMMRANGQLSHTPPDTWTCYTTVGASAAGRSNISGGQSVRSVPAYMGDIFAPTTLGHRRWILNNRLGPIGIGGTSSYSCLLVIGGSGSANKPWVAWPAPGPFPFAAVSESFGGSLDDAGWSIQSDSINLNAATVTVTANGVDAPVAVTPLSANYGSTSAIKLVPDGWTTQAGTTYQVSVAGVPTPFSYTVNVVVCP